MSRVVYTDAPDTAEREALRAAHAVRCVTTAEEGAGVDALPGGVYGFTYSPGLLNAPLFSTRRYRGYEIHKLPAGETFVIGYAEQATASTLAKPEEATVKIQPEPVPGADVLVVVPYSRILRHRQYAAPNQDGFTVMVAAKA